MGEIPDKGIFIEPEFWEDLYPYFQIVFKVREGELDQFKKLVQQYKDLFLKDGNFNLIGRLRHNVIKFGLKKINLSYSKISLKDVTNKLGLESIHDTECIIAKAIRDGVIDATIDHEKQHLQTREVVNLYTSNEPQQVFDKRIRFCMELHSKSVKGLKFAPKEEKKDIFDIPRESHDEINFDALDGLDDY